MLPWQKEEGANIPRVSSLLEVRGSGGVMAHSLPQPKWWESTAIWAVWCELVSWLAGSSVWTFVDDFHDVSSHLKKKLVPGNV